MILLINFIQLFPSDAVFASVPRIVGSDDPDICRLIYNCDYDRNRISNNFVCTHKVQKKYVHPRLDELFSAFVKLVSCKHCQNIANKMLLLQELEAIAAGVANQIIPYDKFNFIKRLLAEQVCYCLSFYKYKANCIILEMCRPHSGLYKFYQLCPRAKNYPRKYSPLFH